MEYLKLSPLGGAGAQFFDDNGNPLSGGRLFTYAAGTTTRQETFMSPDGTKHSNPIILDAAGRVPGGEIWIDDRNYKFVLTTPSGSQIATWDYIIGSPISQKFIGSINVEEDIWCAKTGFFKNLEVTSSATFNDNVHVKGSLYAKTTRLGQDGGDTHLNGNTHLNGPLISNGAELNDLIPKAWGLISDTGSLIYGLGIQSVVKTATGRYLVTLARELKAVEDIVNPSNNKVPVVIGSPIDTDQRVYWEPADLPDTGKKIEFSIYNGSGTLEDGYFSFVVFGEYA